MALPRWHNGRKSACQYRRHKRCEFDPWVGRFPGVGYANHSSILASEIPWTEEPCRLQPMGSQRVRHDWTTQHTMLNIEPFFNLFTFNWRIIAPQSCVGFCHISTWISCRYTYIPSLLSLPPTSYHIPPL